MKIAIPVWNGRVSPVFDVAKSIRVFDIADGAAVNMSVRELGNGNHAAEMVELGVDVLICAAISIPLEATLWVSGVEVIPDNCGAVREIIEAFSSGDRALRRFRSPGNSERRRSSRETPSHHRRGTRSPR